MADRTLDELRAYFNSFKDKLVSDIDFTMTDGEKILLAAHLSVKLQTHTKLDEDGINAVRATMMFIRYCPGFADFAKAHLEEVLALAGKMMKENNERRNQVA